MNQVALTKFAAYLLTDGCITVEGDGGFYATLINKSPALLEDFRNTLSILGLDSNITEQTRSWRVRKGCKQLIRKIAEMYKIPLDGKKFLKTEAEIPTSVLSDKKLIAEFLRVVASTEGYVRCTRNRKGGFARRIVLGSLNKRFSEQLLKALSILGINSKLSKQGVIIYGQDNISSFGKLVGFVDGCKTVRGPKKGKLKSTVLKELLFTYSSRRAKRP